MKMLFVGLCALSLCAGFAPKTAAQSVTITMGPVDDSYWVWNEEYQCWIWNGPEFQGDYEGHPYAYWHARHEGDNREHRPHRAEQREAVRQDEQHQERVEQPKVEVEQPQQRVEQPRVEQPRVEQPRVEHKQVEKAEEHPKVEKAKVEHKEEKAKDEKTE